MSRKILIYRYRHRLLYELHYGSCTQTGSSQEKRDAWINDYSYSSLCDEVGASQKAHVVQQ